MPFSSLLFVFFFLPSALLIYYVMPERLRNLALILFSLLFYAWANWLQIPVLLSYIAVNFAFGYMISKITGKGWKTIVLTLGVAANLLPLVYWKYSEFIIYNIRLLLPYHRFHFELFKELQAPLGISFIVFHGISYIFDIFKDSRRFRSDFLQTCLFLSFFPKILAGPIFRYNEALEQLEMRTISFENFAYGAERFIIGLGKKLLLANALAKIANPIFEAPYTELGAGYAWLGAICYTLQIYYDFSGYTDMAVGVGYMFGFKLPENFQYPYSAQSIREFWQKWHITLSTWFREYLYIPLGGNRFGAGRTYFNLAVVFFLCGLWHGANWTFIIWGLFHGFFLILERMGLSGLLKRLPVPFRHLYLLVVIVFSWVFFRSTNLENALGFSGAMLGIHQMPQANPWILLNINVQFWVVLTVAILFSFPLFSIVRPGKTVEIQSISHKNKLTGLFAMKSVALSFLFIFSVIELASGSYNPFIYFKF